MPKTFDDKLVVAISSRALFDLDESNRVFEEQGLDAYYEYQIKHENDVLAKGGAFALVEKLLALNKDRPRHPRVEVILLSRNSADTGLRVFNSIQHYGLGITRAAFTGGNRPYRYATSFGAHLFLSSHPDDVRNALAAGIAAATVFPRKAASGADGDPGQLRIAFDGDAVLFSDEAERVYQEQGLDAFSRSEQEAADRPLEVGPFHTFLSALQRIQAEYPADASPIRTALVTARSAPAHKRVILTLRHWGIRIDEAVFLGGLAKGDFLKAFGADIFFDDQFGHCESAIEHVPAGHVPSGVING
ncbi:MAG: 5'-nucleotidase [Gammaproteobacteria bacterium]|nr:5'-nucleotidase [Gammaproteobacteria bacterium]